MRVLPILIDSRPGYLLGAPPEHSLLTMPLGSGTVLSYFYSRIAAVTRTAVTVLSSFEPGPGYEKSVRGACPAGAVEAVLSAAEFDGRTNTLEPSDWFMITDPRSFPAEGLHLEELLSALVDDPRWVRHLVALDSGHAGTRECVQFDAQGRVARIQRYYDAVTWPFATGVACSLVPVSATLATKDFPFASLPALRAALVARGVPSRDLPLSGAIFDFGLEGDLLTLGEKFMLQAAPKGSDGAPSPWLAPGCSIHPSARLLGPVVVQNGASVEEGATVVGPSVLGAGARVGRGAVVAQCALAAGAVVPEESTVRHRLVVSGPGDALPAGAPDAVVADPPFPWRGLTPGAIPIELEDEGERALYPRIKAVAEPIIALAALILLSPLLLLVALLVKLDSRGPVLYGAKREGQGGRVFRCWKFRTMGEGAEQRQRELYSVNQMDGPQFKLDSDPRVTRMGRLLRPTSLDELPQLLNVLFSHMSFVGPRPSPFRENQMCVPWRRARLAVRPGITGLWQVCRHDRAQGDFHQWIYYDLLYVRLMSLWLDIKIIIATVLTLGGKTCAPLSWIIAPQDFYDRRRSRRDRDGTTAKALRPSA